MSMTALCGRPPFCGRSSAGGSRPFDLDYHFEPFSHVPANIAFGEAYSARCFAACLSHPKCRGSLAHSGLSLYSPPQRHPIPLLLPWQLSNLSPVRHPTADEDGNNENSVDCT
eukprot:EG_transcript_32781